MKKQIPALLVIHSAKINAKTKARRKKQFDRIMEESNRICATMEKRIKK